MSLQATLHKRWRNVAMQLDRRTARERVLLALTLIAAIGSLVYLLALMPAAKTLAKAQTAAAQLQASNQVLLTDVQDLQGQLSQSEEEAKAKKLRELEQSVRDAGTLTSLLQGMVSPAEMAPLVERILESNHALKVIRVENRMAEPLRLGGAENNLGQAQPAAGAAEGFVVYKHGLHIEVRGSYRDIVKFLMALEKMQWKVMWDQVSITTDDKHAGSLAALTIYTLSLDQAWLGL
ncbi:MAG: hypothetical protein AB1810_11415 [Pseudomonadota bacterium]